MKKFNKLLCTLAITLYLAGCANSAIQGGTHGSSEKCSEPENKTQQECQNNDGLISDPDTLD